MDILEIWWKYLQSWYLIHFWNFLVVIITQFYITKMLIKYTNVMLWCKQKVLVCNFAWQNQSSFWIFLKFCWNFILHDVAFVNWYNLLTVKTKDTSKPIFGTCSYDFAFMHYKKFGAMSSDSKVAMS